MTFLEELHRQRWDDHRYYHHNRVNQMLHLLSASCFLASYVLLFANPVAAVIVGWMLAMVLRQVGHFLFEPRTFDKVYGVSHNYKESIKVGYNLRRKVVLLSIWFAAPVLLWAYPGLMSLFGERQAARGLVYCTALAWFYIGVGAVLFRSLQLFFLMGIQSGLVWACKILTDPFHDVRIYWKSPLHLLRGDLYDDMSEWYVAVGDEAETARPG